MTGPTVYSNAINCIHKKLFNTTINHSQIKADTDITFKLDDISYRIFGIDYNHYFTFTHDARKFLYLNKKHWSVEQKEKLLLKSD